MRTKVVATLLCLIVVSSSSRAQETLSVAHKFQLWSLNKTDIEKVTMFEGWTNGFFQGPRPKGFHVFMECIENRLTEGQAIAMIDKYYKANPERWGVPLGEGIVSALTVSSSPCAGIDPWK